MKVCLGVMAASGMFLGASLARADEIPAKYRPTVDKALEWLVKQQGKDGHWGANSGQSPVAMTSLAGLALVMEGSTIREGKYAQSIRRAADWVMERCMKGGGRDGLIGNPDHPAESGRYMYGHGFGLLFLSCVYGDEDDKDRRERLKDILTRAVKYTAAAQSDHQYPKNPNQRMGGWYYISRTEGGNNDEGSVTITQVQGLRAARNAGVPVPKEVIKKTHNYLAECTGPGGGVYYSLRSRNERPAITAAAISCLFNAGEYKDELCKKWFKYCQRTIGIGSNIGGGRIGHDEYTHFYFAQCMYILGDDGWEKLYGPTPENDRMTWSKYRTALFDHIQRIQQSDGSFVGGGWGVGPVYSTAMYAIIMQLDKGTLPIFQR